MSEMRLVVNGASYGGWEKIRVTRSIESISGSFSLEASDRWGGQEVAWPILEEDECRVEIDGEVVIDGWVDKRRLSLSATARTLAYDGRDRTSALVDCSAMIEGTGKKWSFRDEDIAYLATQLGAEHGIKVTIQPGLELIPSGKCVLNPGDTAYHALQRLAAATGVLLVSDGHGGLLITRAGTERIETALVQGQNVLSASIDYDATDRFYKYDLRTQSGASGVWHELDGGGFPVTDAGAAQATAVVREVHTVAVDQGVRRKGRVLLIRPEGGMDTTLGRRRVDWEARVRAARAEKVMVTVSGWRQRGQLWPLNKLVSVQVPSIGIAGDLLISQAEHTIGDGGELTQLSLVRPDAFLPEPHKVGTVGGSGRWKELDR